MITIMVENQPKPTAKNKTTLVVVPGSMVDEWVTQVGLHTDRNVMDNILVYRSGSRIDSPDVVQSMRRFQIIVTTYHEVSLNLSPEGLTQVMLTQLRSCATIPNVSFQLIWSQTKRKTTGGLIITKPKRDPSYVYLSTESSLMRLNL